MSELTVKISKSSHDALLQLAETSGESMQTILERAIENYRRTKFLIEANQAFEKLRQNEELWQDELKERQEWDQTIADGLEE